MLLEEERSQQEAKPEDQWEYIIAMLQAENTQFKIAFEQSERNLAAFQSELRALRGDVDSKTYLLMQSNQETADLKAHIQELRRLLDETKRSRRHLFLKLKQSRGEINDVVETAAKGFEKANLMNKQLRLAIEAMLDILLTTWNVEKFNFYLENTPALPTSDTWKALVNLVQSKVPTKEFNAKDLPLSDIQKNIQGLQSALSQIIKTQASTTTNDTDSPMINQAKNSNEENTGSRLRRGITPVLAPQSAASTASKINARPKISTARENPRFTGTISKKYMKGKFQLETSLNSPTDVKKLSKIHNQDSTTSLRENIKDHETRRFFQAKEPDYPLPQERYSTEETHEEAVEKLREAQFLYNGISKKPRFATFAKIDESILSHSNGQRISRDSIKSNQPTKIFPNFASNSNQPPMIRHTAVLPPKTQISSLRSESPQPSAFLQNHQNQSGTNSLTAAQHHVGSLTKSNASQNNLQNYGSFLQAKSSSFCKNVEHPPSLPLYAVGPIKRQTTQPDSFKNRGDFNTLLYPDNRWTGSNPLAKDLFF
eukprot:GHVP01034551.1.p1 GENE.GHVP01034551.1~~GHVP01034551.1.p1  ORF type:complete len:541 (+),score=93.02 GHVP01034551.1:1368-2990(+)